MSSNLKIISTAQAMSLTTLLLSLTSQKLLKKVFKEVCERAIPCCRSCKRQSHKGRARTLFRIR